MCLFPYSTDYFLSQTFGYLAFCYVTEMAATELWLQFAIEKILARMNGISLLKGDD